MVIDAHTHIYNEQMWRDYRKRARGRIDHSIVFAWFDFDHINELLNLASVHPELSIVGTVDMGRDIQEQVEHLDQLFADKKIVGIKLYPGYQYFTPADGNVKVIADLCQSYNKPLIFHSGDVWDIRHVGMLKYSHPMHVDELATLFPDCRIIIAHIGFPFMLEAVTVAEKNKNVYLDMSGTIDDSGNDKDIKPLRKRYVRDIKSLIDYYPGVKNKILFGTDYYGEDSPLRLIDPYFDTVREAFPKEVREKVLSGNARKLFFE
ncbi:MAG TPA: amidohydrolase family protein [Candidatus Magasanikbacteria bacterium]|nr:amidohydrolase family protein [Candidatus Magasanikbacteria bacterium]